MCGGGGGGGGGGLGVVRGGGGGGGGGGGEGDGIQGKWWGGGGGGGGVEPKLSAISSHSNGNSQQTFLNLLSFVYHHQCNPDFVSWHTLTFDQQTP